MHTIEIPDRDITIHLPSSWDECNSDQVDYIIQSAYAVIRGQQSLLDFQVDIFCYLAGLEMTLPYALKNKMKLANPINERIAILATQLCAWPFRETDQGIELQYDTIVNHYPVIVSDDIKLFGPEDLLTDITYGEFRWAIDYMNDYFAAMKAKDAEGASHALDAFLVCLYRPNRAKKRMPFQSDDIPDLVLHCQSISHHIKQTILLWFTTCITTIQSSSILIHGAEVDFSILFPESSSSDDGTTVKQKNSLGWHGLLYDIAETGIFGDLEASDRANLFSILTYLVKKKNESIEQERAMKAARKKK